VGQPGDGTPGTLGLRRRPGPVTLGSLARSLVALARDVLRAKADEGEAQAHKQRSRY
jgi:hypothetical protein